VAPSLWLRLVTPIITVQQATPAQAALIFGAVVRDGAISPLHAERLAAGKALLDREIVPTLVVSNTPRAADAMATYLTQQGVPRPAVRLDPQAERSPDTCASAQRDGLSDVILVSQRFHLPRLKLHCARYGLSTQFVMADSADRAPASTPTKIRVRTRRFLRETALIWGTLLRLYPHQPTS